MNTNSRISIVLIGYEPKGSENLSLRLLAAAVHGAGMDARVMTSPSIELSCAVVERAVDLNPRCIGFSLQDPINAIHALALAALTRKRGYAGFIVAGGPTATLQTNWVLDRCSAVDAVIRHDGEAPLVQLLSALAAGDSISSIPAMATREFSNPPSVVTTQPVWRPVRDGRPSVLGVPTADVIAGRGCHDRCSYCTHAAQASLVTREVLSSGVDAATLRASGLGSPSARPIGDLADEMAALYHQDGVRYFNFIDENPVPGSQNAALDWIGCLGDAFSVRGMSDLAFGMMTRADRLTEPVVDRLVELGLVRTLVGVESGSAKGLDRVGRRGAPTAAADGLRMLSEAGVVTLFNSLLLQPGSDAEDIRAELKFLSTVEGAMFDTVAAVPMVGTDLHRSMLAQGRLRGDGPLPSFEVDSPAVEKFRSLMGRLQTGVMGPYNPTFRVNDLLLSALLAGRFSKQWRRFGALEARLREQVEIVNQLRVQTLTGALDVAMGLRPLVDLFDDAGEQFGEVLKTLAQIERQMEGFHTGWTVARSLGNLAAAATLVFAMSSVQACYRVDEIGGADTTDADTDSDTDADTDTDVDTDTDTDTNVEECTDEEYWNEYYTLESMFWDNCDYWNYAPVLEVTLDEDGAVISITLPYEDGIPAWAAELLLCYNELLAGETFPCLAGETIWIEGGFAGGLA